MTKKDFNNIADILREYVISGKFKEHNVYLLADGLSKVFSNFDTDKFIDYILCSEDV